MSRILNPTLPLWQGITNFVFNSIVLLFLPIFLIRFMRLKLVRSGPELVAILPRGEQTLHSVFSGISNLLSPILIGAALVGLVAIPGASPTANNLDPGLSGLFDLISTIFSAISLGTFLWVYLSSLRGLYKLGAEALRLRSSIEDPMLGLRPLGSISLSFAFAYFFVVAIGAFTLLILPFGFSDIALLAVFMIVGTVMFFLPLNSAHRKMQEAKRVEQRSIQKQFDELAKKSSNSSRDDLQGEATLARIEQLLTIQMLDRKASSIPTWPFDTSILGRFAAIILSVVAIVIARTITFALHL